MYLHSYSDKSFNDYKNDIINSAKEEIKNNYIIDDDEKVNIVKKSTDVLKNFTPAERSINNGTI